MRFEPAGSLCYPSPFHFMYFFCGMTKGLIILRRAFDHFKEGICLICVILGRVGNTFRFATRVVNPCQYHSCLHPLPNRIYCT